MQLNMFCFDVPLGGHWKHRVVLISYLLNFLGTAFSGIFDPDAGEEICGSSKICRNFGHCTNESVGSCYCSTGFIGTDCSIRVECQPLGNYVENAIIRPTPYDAVPAPYGMILTYRCFDNYQFQNAEDIEGGYIHMTSCNGTGQWDPAPVTCKAVCPPFATWRGYLADSDARMEGDVVTYQCYGVYPSWEVNVDWVGQRRYKFGDDVPNPDVDKVATCLSNGTWYPPIPECTELLPAKSASLLLHKAGFVIAGLISFLFNVPTSH